MTPGECEPEWNFREVRVQEKNQAALLGMAQKFRLFLLTGIVLFFTLPLSSSFARESAETILKKLDAHYYYPQEHGLFKVSVQIDWEQLDTTADSKRYLKNPPLAFFWEKGGVPLSRGGFKLADESFEISVQRKNELLAMLENYKEVVIPQTLVEKMSDYKGKVTVAKGRRGLMEFSSLDPNATIRKYDLVVDLAQKNVRRFRVKRSGAPTEVKSDVRYAQKGGKWLFAESRSTFRMGEMDYNEITEFVYRQVQNFWLVGKMTQTIKTDDRIIQSFIFRFRDYKIN
ncbi:MAG: hypothetical protein NPINA01_31890 [Nitrospinaceae bacterium]|nr:MAG: hypothetical protein NPINA01_31890 [Nitrospinaceae bacterium]